jgi:hypothetical protein
MIPDVPGLTDTDHLHSARKELDKMASHVENAVRLAGHAISALSADRITEDELPPVFLLRHAASQVLGVAAMTRAGLVEPTEPLLRSTLEAMLSLLYMLEKDRVPRARAYQVCEWRSQIAQVELLDTTTRRGEQYAKALAEDVFVGNMAAPVTEARRQEVIDAKMRLLGKPTYAPLESEWQRLHASRRRVPHWYSFFDGPNNLGELARHLKAGAVYSILYGFLSERSHAAGVSDALVKVEGGGTVKHLVYPVGLERSVVLAVALLSHAATTFLETFGSPEHLMKYARLHQAEVSPHQRALAGRTVFVMYQ